MYDVYLLYKKQHGLSAYISNCYRTLEMAEKAIMAIDNTAKLLKSNVENSWITMVTCTISTFYVLILLILKMPFNF